MNFEDRVALVTGGGTGIGRGVSEALARGGVKVAVNYSQSKEGAEEVVRHIVAAGGVAEPSKASVASEADVRHMMEQIERDLAARGGALWFPGEIIRRSESSRAGPGPRSVRR